VKKKSWRRAIVRAIVAVAMALLLVFMVATVCAFQAQPYPPTLCEMLLLFGTAAVIQTGAGALVAALVEYWPGWAGLAPKWKRPMIFAFCLVLPLASLAVRVLLCGALLTQDTLYLAGAAGAFAFAGSQFAHIYKLPSG